MPTFEEKDVDYCSDNNPAELTDFFATCNSEEQLAFMFILYSAHREREVMSPCCNDDDFVNRWFQLAGQSRPGAPAQDQVLVCEATDSPWAVDVAGQE